MQRSLFSLLACLAAALIPGLEAHAEAQHSWDPGKTRVFIVCLARFEGETTPSFSMDDRLDGQLAQQFRELGVPPEQVVFLMDEQATRGNIERRFAEFLRASRPDELLIVYFGSHGGYDAESGAYTFSAFDQSIPFVWLFDSIEHAFRGSKVWLLGDTCYSGGIAELAPTRTSPIAYACLSSTYAHNVAWSRWRFIGCLLRGLRGDPLVDLDGDGEVRLDELAHYTERYMAFAAEGKPMFQTTHDFDSSLGLARTQAPKSAPRVGELVEARANGSWYKAEIRDEKDGRLLVHDTEENGSADAWLDPRAIRPFQFPRFQVGERVEAQGSSSGRWYPATVLERFESLYLCRYDGYSPAYDEWIGPSRIRALGRRPQRQGGFSSLPTTMESSQ